MNGINILFDTCAVIKLPDCIVAATSIALNAILLTDDDKLLNLSYPCLRTQNIL